MKKLLLIFAMLLPIVANAYDFMVDGVAYNILSATDLTCVVTEGCVPDNGKLVIPATVNYKNRTLTVIGIGDGKGVASYHTITDLTIENGPTYIEGSAFVFQRIQRLWIPPSIKLIKSDGFGSNMGHESGLASWISEPFEVIIEDGEDLLEGEAPTFFPYPFNKCKITRLYLGRSIDDKLFNGFGSLEDLTIGDLVTSVTGEGVSMSFYMSSLKKLTVGKKLEIVPNLQETSIDEIYIRSETPPLSEGFKDGTYVSATLYVPRGTKEVYENAPTWQNFWTIEEYDVIDNKPSNLPSAYAEFDNETGTLTFKYGVKPEGENVYETIYDLAEEKKIHGFGFISPWYFKHSELKTVVFDESYSSVRPKNMYKWFMAANNLTAIKGLKNLNTSEVETMAGMFEDCSSLTEIDLSTFDTGNVTDMSSMFSGCSSLRKIFAGEGWTTASVINSTYMFLDCTSLIGGAGSVYDNEHTDHTYAHIDGGTENPGYFSEYDERVGYAIFDKDNGTLTFKYEIMPDGDNVYETEYTDFDFDKPAPWVSNDLKYVVFDKSYSLARPTSTAHWFDGASKLLSIRGIENLNTREVTKMTRMFCGCVNLSYLDVSNFNTEKVSTMNGMFSVCENLVQLDLSSFNTEKVVDMGYMFSGCSKLIKINLSSLNTEKAVSMILMFNGCSYLTQLDLRIFNTSNVTRMENMFSNCGKLRAIYVSDKWSTAKVTNGENMFIGCSKLSGSVGTKYDNEHNNFDYARVDGGTVSPGYLSLAGEGSLPGTYAITDNEAGTLTFKYGPVPEGKGVTWLDDDADVYLTYYHWKEGDGFYSPWHEGRGIKTIVFDKSYAVARPQSTWMWFAYFEDLTSVEGLENFITSELKDMSDMFYRCSNLTELDLSGLNTSNVTNMSYLFADCNSLKTVYVGDQWSTASVTKGENLFKDCTSLVGGAGTVYDSEHVGVEYAHIDGGTENPGYFSKRASVEFDVNNDGKLDAKDIVDLVDFIAGKNPKDVTAASADVNGDNKIDIADVVGLSNIIIKNQ